jgi:hypothetical protein
MYYHERTKEKEMRVNTDDYKNLEDYGMINVSNNIFMPVFITGEPREDQEFGKMQIGDLNKTLFQRNLTRVFFIPLFVKQIWTKYITEKNEKGDKIDRLVDFSWDTRVKPKIVGDPNCKFSYLIGGLFIDETTKKKVSHPYVDDKDALIYFNCRGIKVGSALDFNKLLDTSVSEYMARSDYQSLTANEQGTYDYDREKVLCGYRRLLCYTEVGYADSNHGRKQTFKFGVVKEKTADGKSDRVKVLNPEYTKTILDLCKDTQKDFTKQFDKTSYINNKYTIKPEISSTNNPTFDEPVQPKISGPSLQMSVDQELSTVKKEKVQTKPVTDTADDTDAFDLDLNI